MILLVVGFLFIIFLKNHILHLLKIIDEPAVKFLQNTSILVLSHFFKSAGFSFPLPISTIVPTIARTIFLRNLFIEMVNLSSISVLFPNLRDRFYKYWFYYPLLTFAKLLKSSVLKRILHASFIFSTSRVFSPMLLRKFFVKKGFFQRNIISIRSVFC